MSEHKGKAEELLQQFGRQVDQFLGEVKEASSKVELDLQANYEKLKKSAEEIKRESTDPHRWKEVEASLKKAGEELEKAVRAAFRKKQ